MLRFLVGMLFLSCLVLSCLGSAEPAYPASIFSPCTQSGPTASECDPVNTGNPLPDQRTSDYPYNSTAITGNATGTTGAVVGTLTAVAAKTTFICGFNVSAVGTGAVGPITIAGLITASMVYQLTAAAAGASVTQTFTPCIPASAANTNITITTTADASASAVDVNSWGYNK
jgi:hypothetical protein